MSSKIRGTSVISPAFRGTLPLCLGVGILELINKVSLLKPVPTFGTSKPVAGRGIRSGAGVADKGDQTFEHESVSQRVAGSERPHLKS
ncbi:unnamed protein product [Larinioides sclopetarius]|uniref:Uncharacterized protein n=1 Tax=Larinioides sclopetarius TaxID=280406 RepID=A0AAV2BES6_9ARAC